VKPRAAIFQAGATALIVAVSQLAPWLPSPHRPRSDMSDRSEHDAQEAAKSDPQDDEYGRVEPETPSGPDSGAGSRVDSPEYAHEKDDD
jgi:hypothetical protein